MGQAIPSIPETIRTQLASGKVINVDEWCDYFQPLFSHLIRIQISDEIISTICSSGGDAVWGEAKLTIVGPDDDADLQLGR